MQYVCYRFHTENFEIIRFKVSVNILNQRNELIVNCRHRSPLQYKLQQYEWLYNQFDIEICLYRICTYVGTCICIYAGILIFQYMCMVYLYSCVRIFLHIWVHIYADVCVCVCTCIWVFLYICIFICFVFSSIICILTTYK